MDEGSFAEVIVEARRGNNATKADESALRELTEKVRLQDEKIAQMEADVLKQTEVAAQASVTKSVPRVRRFDKETIRKERADIFTEIDEILKKPVGGAVGSGIGGISPGQIKQIAALSKPIQRLGLNLAKEGLAQLEEVVVQVQRLFKERYGVDLDRQDIVDALGKTEERKPRSEIQKQIDELRREARKATTAAKEAQTLKTVEQDIKDITDDLLANEKRLDDLEVKSILSSDARTKRNIEGARKALADGQAKIDRVKDAKARKELRDWWQVQTDILDLEEQIATGGYWQTVKGTKSVSAQMEDSRALRDLYASRVRAAVRESQKPMAGRAARGIAETVRGVKLGTDVGIVTRQGLFSWARPASTVKGIKEGAKAMFSEQNLANWQRAIDKKTINGRSVVPIRKEAGLSLTDGIGRQEEVSVGRALRKFYGWSANQLEKAGAKKTAGLIRRVGESTLGALDRFQTVFINTVRTEAFDAGIRAGFNPTELRNRARFINNATGRGNIKNVPDSLALALTSPRYEASRWAMLKEPFHNAASLGIEGAKGKLDRGSLANLQDMAVTAGSVVALYKVAEVAGFEVEWDPVSADFLKMRRGEKVWDPTAGIAPRLRDTIRLLVWWRHPDYRENWGEVLKGAVTRPISPTVRTPVEFFSSRAQIAAGEDPKSPFSGFETEEDQTGWRAFAPLIIDSYLQAYEKEGAGSGAASFGLEAIGQSVSMYPQSGSSSGSSGLKTLKGIGGGLKSLD